MKKLICFLFFLPAIFGYTQMDLYKDSPLDYAWKYVGNEGFSLAEADNTSLAISPSGQPYVAFLDMAHYQKTTVMKFDGINWVNVGNAGFSVGSTDFISLAFSPTGQPFVAYKDLGNSNKTSVMRFDGTKWVNVGNAGFSAGEADCTSLAFNPSDSLPYVAYEDYGNSRKATVIKYDSVMVGVNEKQESKISLCPNPATDIITVETSAVPAQGELSILNLQGQQLLTRQLTEPKTQIDISNLPSGVYFVRVTSEKTVEVGKFIKQ